MFIESLRVQGFKSLADVTLTDLRAVNVFHGLNDVGKSNILQAIDLFFQLLPEAARALTGEDEMEGGVGLKNADLQPYTPSVFRQGGDGTITWEAQMRVVADMPPVWLRLRLVNAREGLQVVLEWEKPAHFDGQPEDVALRWLHDVCADPANDFTLVTAERRFAKEWMGEETASIDYAPYRRRGSPVESARLKQVLFEAVPHRDFRQRERFKRLAKILNEQFGVGELDVTWDAPREVERRANEPGRYVRDILVRFLRPDFPEPVLLEDIGSGVQQLILLLGQMLFNPARSVGIEEPEMNLSPKDWQGKLMAIFRELVDSHTLDQIFITSHSPEFEFQDSFYRVTYENQATQVARFPLAKREDFFGPQQPLGEQRGQRLNSQNQVTLYQEVMADLNLSYGDMVYFVKNAEGRWEIYTEDKAMSDLQEYWDDAEHSA